MTPSFGMSDRRPTIGLFGEDLRPQSAPLCPICSHDLSPRHIPLRDWLLHPVRSWKRKQFDLGYPASHVLLNHGHSETGRVYLAHKRPPI